MASKPVTPSGSPSSTTKRQHVVRPFFRKVKTEIHDLFHHHDQDSRQKHHRSASPASSVSFKTPSDTPLPKSIPPIPPSDSKTQSIPDTEAVVGYDVHDDSLSTSETGYFDKPAAPLTQGTELSQSTPRVTSEPRDIDPASPPALSAATPEPELVVIPEASEASTPSKPEPKEQSPSHSIQPSSNHASNANELSKVSSSTDGSGDNSTPYYSQEEDSGLTPEIAGRGITEGGSPLVPGQDSAPQIAWELAPELLEEEATDIDTSATESRDKAAINAGDVDIKDEALPEAPAFSPAFDTTDERHANEDDVEATAPHSMDGKDSPAVDQVLAVLPEMSAMEPPPEVKQELPEPDFSNALSPRSLDGVTTFSIEKAKTDEVHTTHTNEAPAVTSKPIHPESTSIYWDIYATSAAAEGGKGEFGSRSHPSGTVDDEDEEFGSRSRMSRVFPMSSSNQNNRPEDWLDMSTEISRNDGRAQKGLTLEQDPLDGQVRYRGATNTAFPNSSLPNGRSAQAGDSLGNGLGGCLVDLVQMAILFPFIATLCIFYYVQDFKNTLLSYVSWVRRKPYTQAR